MDAQLIHLTERTTLSTKGQLVIPKVVREQTKWLVGDSLEVSVVEDEVRIRRVHPAPPHVQAAALDAVAGCLKRAGRTPISDADLKRRIGQRLRAKL